MKEVSVFTSDKSEKNIEEGTAEPVGSGSSSKPAEIVEEVTIIGQG